MTKLVHLYASQRVSRRAKDGSDGTSVTILYTKVSYQVSASPTKIPDTWYDDIKNAIQTDSKPYLWSKTTVVYSDNKTITTTYSVSYKGKDGTNGTSFTPKGTATGFFYNMSSVPSYEDGMDSDVYIVNVDDRSYPTSELPPYVCHFEYENFIIEHAEFGDGYNVKGHLYVANSNEWVDFGEIQGAKGDPGDPGIDAINIVLSPAELVFDADENGNLKQAEKSAEVKVFRGNKQLTYLTDWDFPNVGGKQPGDNCKATFMVEGNSSPLKPIVKIYDISSTDIVGTTPQAKVPASSGGINVPIKVNDVTYNAYLSFAVNVNTFAHTLIQDNKKYISKYTEISNKYNTVSNELNGKASKDELMEVSSSIEQTARRISLEVSSNAVGRRNMLVNSAFRNQDSVFIHSLARIEKITGIDGVNCIHSSDKYSGTGDGNYIGAFWDSTQKNGVVTNIPIRMGKKYVISCWIKSDNKDLPFVIECFFMNSINQQNRPEDAVRKEYHVDNVNEWKRIDFVVDTTDTSEYASKVTPYLAVNIWSNTKNVPKATGATEYPTCHAYICKPMMEEGDTYGGWTLSEDDYDYVGGNILDNTRSLEKSGNLEKEESEIINEGYEYAYAVAHSNNTTSTQIEMLQWNVAGRINDGQDYMFSFLAKGTGMVSTYLWKDGTPRFFVESSNNKHNAVSSDGRVDFDLTKEWKRYWVHYHLNTSAEHPLPEKLLIRCYGGNEVYICQPKLEIGATMTEFTERKTDLVDKASLKKAGINITSDMVELYGNQVKVSGAKGGTPVAMFENGMLNSNLINADKIMARQLQTTGSNGQSVSIENGLMRVYGTNGRCNIEFGVNSNGEAILSYYDKDGKWLYDLGPNKLDGGQLTESTLEGDKYVTAASFFGTNKFFSLETDMNVTVKQVYREYSEMLFGNNLFSNDDQEIANNNAAHIGYQPFARVSNVTNLYRYTAPRQSGTIIKDEVYGLTTPALAKQADGKYFTNNVTLAINGQLTNLAPAGYYFRQSEQVMMAPYPMLSAETQSPKFPAYSIRCLNINIDSTGTVMSGFNGMMSYLMKTIKIQI